MPQACAAFGCSNRRTVENRGRGITFHKFPKEPGARRTWAKALRRREFTPSDTTVVCSSHFLPEDFDRTGQTVRLKEGVVPSVFAFPNQLNRVPNKATSTRTSLQACEPSYDPVPVSDVPEPPIPANLDHPYAVDPDHVKDKLTEAQRRAYELQRQLRNAKDHERRTKRIAASLVDELREKNQRSTTQRVASCWTRAGQPPSRDLSPSSKTAARTTCAPPTWFCRFTWTSLARDSPPSDNSPT
uniref:THAP domain-containing protein 2-like isoform X2 n=1 Tax=Epinephelus lanceolatus TaxID=310571 RepID=UPI00144558C2|nr:THAP domain-containing protein 2-like isoform X2 [Epinephelus lanceolatus]